MYACILYMQMCLFQWKPFHPRNIILCIIYSSWRMYFEENKKNMSEQDERSVNSKRCSCEFHFIRKCFLFYFFSFFLFQAYIFEREMWIQQAMNKVPTLFWWAFLLSMIFLLLLVYREFFFYVQCGFSIKIIRLPNPIFIYSNPGMRQNEIFGNVCNYYREKYVVRGVFR